MRDQSNHSKIVDRNFLNIIISPDETTSNLQSFGKFQTYPAGVFNPAFCGMMLWELSPNHILNDYKICQFHQIKCGIIMYGCNAYIFTPITNNDIQSFLKILLRDKKLKDSIPANRASKQLVYYVRERGRNHIIPSIPEIQQHLQHILGINDQTYVDNESTYLTLLHRIYIPTFMLRYKMPLQRKAPPGNRNLASSVYCFRSKGWYSHLSTFEQKLLNNQNTVIANEVIPDDLIYGVCRSDIKDLSKSANSDIQNTTMFRDNTMNSMEFQNKIQVFRHLHSSQRNKMINSSTTPTTPEPKLGIKQLTEVPTIEFLNNRVKDCMFVNLVCSWYFCFLDLK